MRLIITLLAFCIHFTIHAQIEELPLQNNIKLIGNSKIEGVERVSFQQIATRGVSYTCILPGDTSSIVVDTSGFGADCLVGLKKNPSSGVAQIFDKTNLEYIANTGISFALDSFSIELCNVNGTNCEEFFYYYAIERSSSEFIQSTISAAEDTKTEIIIPLSQVPSPVVSFELIGNSSGSKAVGYVEKPDKFIFYSGRGGYQNEYKIVACDAFCACDTFIYPVNVKTDTLDLPILDDFSYTGPYPDPKIWINDDVFVNNTFAIKPPSIGVASFDGIDAGGSPYGGGNGNSDYLTSRQIDLGKYVAFDNIYLSYFVEPKGLGNTPEDIDSLVLEFKDKDGNWNKIQGLIPGFPLMVDSFAFQSISITDEKYLYKGFQFRFRNRSDNTGMLDLWHLDYISLSSGVVPTINSSDIAFSLLPKGLLKTYTAMPWRQFENFEEAELNLSGNNLNLSIDLHNFFDKIETADPSNLRIFEKITGIELVNNLPLLELPPLAPVDQRNLEPGFHHFDASKNLPSFLSQIKDDFNGGDNYQFFTEYTVNNSSEANLPAVKRNNKVIQETNMSYYFAYDDGSAEANLAVKKTGSQAAVKFHANVGDTLRAIQIAIPRVFNDVTKQLFNILVWKDNLSSKPIHSDLLVKPFYPDKLFDSLQAYTTFVLMDEALSKEEPVFIPAGDFYVGWQQATDDEFPITVGFDKNNLEAAKNSFVSLSSGWQSLESLNFQGAIMIRPVLGNVKLNNTPDLVSSNELWQTRFTLAPNPANDNLHIISNDATAQVEHLQIYNIQGNLIKTINNQTDIDVSDLTSGMYFIKIKEYQKEVLNTLKFTVSH